MRFGSWFKKSFLYQKHYSSIFENPKTKILIKILRPSSRKRTCIYQFPEPQFTDYLEYITEYNEIVMKFQTSSMELSKKQFQKRLDLINDKLTEIKRNLVEKNQNENIEEKLHNLNESSLNDLKDYFKKSNERANRAKSYPFKVGHKIKNRLRFSKRNHTKEFNPNHTIDSDYSINNTSSMSNSTNRSILRSNTSFNRNQFSNDSNSYSSPHSNTRSHSNSRQSYGNYSNSYSDKNNRNSNNHNSNIRNSNNRNSNNRNSNNRRSNYNYDSTQTRSNRSNNSSFNPYQSNY